MNQEQVRLLLNKYKAGTLSQEEVALLETWYINESAGQKPKLSEDEVDIISNHIRLGLPLADRQLVADRKAVKLWPRIGIAAAVAVITLGVWLYYTSSMNGGQSRLNVGNPGLAMQNDIAPGKKGATLTLADGRKIRLSDAANGELAKEEGVTITKSENGQLTYEIKGSTGESNKINTLSTAKGETYQLRLPDGSTVWLNAASSITYPASLLKDGKRSVKLIGEGYFSVSKDKTHPFIVESNGQEVEVLGTHFNINSYADEGVIKTTLLEGSVRITSLPSTAQARRVGEAIILKPNQQATLKGEALNITEVNANDIVAWKNDKFIFENDNIQYIMRQLERWYNVKVIYNEMPTEKFGGSVSRFDKISSVLEILESAGGVHFKLEGRTLYVSK